MFVTTEKSPAPARNQTPDQPAHSLVTILTMLYPVLTLTVHQQKLVREMTTMHSHISQHFVECVFGTYWD